MDKEMAVHETRMGKVIETFQRELGSIRAGKATPSLLDNIRVDYYGTPTPLKQVATVSAPEPRLLIVQPWDKTPPPQIDTPTLHGALPLYSSPSPRPSRPATWGSTRRTTAMCSRFRSPR